MSKAARLGVLLGLMLAASGARADSCSDIGNFKVKREDVLKTINAMVVAGKGKHLDAEVFCAKARPIVGADNAMMNALVKNKDWCGIPDEVITQFKDVSAKDTAMANKACNVAAEMKKAKEQAAQGGGPVAQPLPSGPL